MALGIRAMNPADYYEIQIQIIGVLNSNFERWMGTTFGVIIAFHFATKNISARLLRVTMFLYIGTSIMFAYRWVNAVTAFLRFDEILIAGGHDPYPRLPYAPWGIGGITIVLMLFGTIATVMYAYRCYKLSMPNDA